LPLSQRKARYEALRRDTHSYKKLASLLSLFDEKAITYIPMYVDRCAKEIMGKVTKVQHVEDITTRGFLSHKRTSGQGIVSTIYQVIAVPLYSNCRQGIER
jgi:hypothetical protein